MLAQQDQPGLGPLPSPTENAMSKSFDRFLGPLAWPLAAFDAYIFIFYLQYEFTGHPGSARSTRAACDC